MRKIGWILIGLFSALLITGVILIFTVKTKNNPSGPSGPLRPGPGSKLRCGEGIVTCPAGEICNDNGECVKDACGSTCSQGEFCNDGFCVSCDCAGLPCDVVLGSSCLNDGENCGVTTKSGGCLLSFNIKDGNYPTKLIPYIDTDIILMDDLSKFNGILKNKISKFRTYFSEFKILGTLKTDISNACIQCKITNMTSPWPERTIKSAFYQICNRALNYFNGKLSVFVYDYKKSVYGQGNGTISIMSFTYTCMKKSTTCDHLADSSFTLLIDLEKSTSIFYQSLIYTQGSNPMNTCVSNDPGVYLIGNTTNLTQLSRCSNKTVSCGGNNKYNSIYPTPSGAGKCMCIDCKGTYKPEVCNDQCIDQDFPARGACNTGPGARFPTGPSLCTNVTPNHCDISPGEKSACDCNSIQCELCDQSSPYPQTSFPTNSKYCGDPELYYFHLYDTNTITDPWHGWAQTGCEKMYQLTDYSPKNYDKEQLTCPPHTRTGVVKRPLPVQNGVFTDWLYAEDDTPSSPGSEPRYTWPNKANGASRGIFKISDLTGTQKTSTQMPVVEGQIIQPTVERGYLIPRPPEKICPPDGTNPGKSDGTCAEDLSDGTTSIPTNIDIPGAIPFSARQEEYLPNCKFSNGDMGIMMRKCDPGALLVNNNENCDDAVDNIYCVGRSSSDLMSSSLNINVDPATPSGTSGSRQFFSNISAYDIANNKAVYLDPPVGCSSSDCGPAGAGDFVGRPSQMIVRAEGYKLFNKYPKSKEQVYQINQNVDTASTRVKTVLYPNYEEAAKDNGLPGQLGKSSANGRSTVVTFQMNASGHDKDNESGFNGNPVFDDNKNMYSITNGEGSGGATDFCSQTCDIDNECPNECRTGPNDNPPYVCRDSPCVRTLKKSDKSIRTPIFAPGDAIPISNFDVVYDINGDGDRSWFLVNGQKTQLTTGTRVTSISGDPSNERATFCTVGDTLPSPSPLVAGDNAFTCAQKLCHMSGNKNCDPTKSSQDCRDKVTGMPPTTWDGDPASTTWGCAGSLSPLPDNAAGNHGFFSICKTSNGGGAGGGYYTSGDQLNSTSYTSSKTGAFIAAQDNYGCDCVGQKQWCGCITNSVGTSNVDIYPDAADQNVKNSFILPESKFFYTGQWHDYSGTDFGCSPYVYQSIFASPAESGMAFTPVDRAGAGRLCTNMGDNEGTGCIGNYTDSNGACNSACPN
jgi:hypothetical protein